MSGDENRRAERDSLTESKARSRARTGSYDAVARYLTTVHRASAHAEERSAGRTRDEKA